MLSAYEEGKDLYAVIAQSAFNNNYEDNLEYYLSGQKIDIDGKTVIAGNGSERYEETVDNSITVKYYEILQTPEGERAASEFKAGDIVLAEDCQLTVLEVKQIEDAVTITFKEI